MIGQNGATESPEMRRETVRTGAAALVAGRFRVHFGRLILSDHALRFVPDEIGTEGSSADGSSAETVMPLHDIAWIDLNPRSRQLTLQITLRSARIYQFRVDAPDWVSLLRQTRERALVAPRAVRHHQSISATW
jgi:hypothetical protein